LLIRGVNGTVQKKAEKLFDIFARLITRTLTLRLLQEVSKGVITWPQWETLTYVRRHEGCSVSELAKGLSVSQPAATKLIDRLVLKGYTIREENPTDRRACRLSLSGSGTDLVDTIRAERHQRFSSLIRQMGEEERAALISGLSGFLEKALADEDILAEVCLQCGDDHDPDCLVSQARTALGL
jgi:DNA-binding MarR family transcriptional regulator